MVLKTETIRSYTAYRPRYNFHLPPWFPNSKYHGDPPILLKTEAGAYRFDIMPP